MADLDSRTVALTPPMAAIRPGVGTRTFRFHPGYAPRQDRTVERFRTGLGAALDVAGALGLRFALVWPSGRDAAPGVEVDTADSRRWMVQSLARAFVGARWVEGDGGARPSTLARWGHADAIGGLPALDVGVGTPWSEVAVRGLRALPEGVVVRWTLSPSASPRAFVPTPPPIEPVQLPVGSRLAGLTAPERALRDALDARSRAAKWAVELRIELLHESGDSLVPRVCALLERASVGVAGATIRWLRPMPWHRRIGPVSFLSGAEVASLFPEPWGSGATGVPASEARTSFILGHSEDGSAVRLPQPESEGRHLAVFGQTGMGKSTVLVRLVLQAARSATVVLFDPIGDTAREVIDRLPAAAVPRTRWIDATKRNATFNALGPLADSNRSSAYREKAKGDLVAALRRVRMFRYADTPFWGPRLEEMLARAVEAAASYPGGTLVDAEALLRGVGRRAPAGVPEKARAAVEALDALARARPEEVDGARRLVAEVTASETLCRLLCDPQPTCAASELVRPGGLTLITGEASSVGEVVARYFLAVLLALTWAELLARPGGAKTFLVLDEAQWYAHDAVAEGLRLGRRSNVHWWLATQSVGSLSETVREAVLTNAADFLVFRGSPDDAREFARWSPDAMADETLALGRGEAIAWLGKGQRRVRVALAPLAPADPLRSRRAAVVAASERDRVRSERRSESDAATSAGMIDPLDVVFAARASVGNVETFEFPFSRARHRLAWDEAAVRELGSHLRRTGSLLRRVATAEGGAWCLLGAATDRLRAQRPPGPLPAEAVAAWERLRSADSRLGQRFSGRGSVRSVDGDR